MSGPKTTRPVIPDDDRLEAAARTLPRRRFFDDMPDKGLFAAVAFLGFLLIILLKTNTPIPSEIIAAMAVTAMLLYGFVAFRLPTLEIRPDRLGDNFYYLGFIYTLASLCAALIQLRSAPQIEELLGNFGIALITTVVGVTGRVLFVQMRGELDDIDARVRRDLAAASADLRSQLVLALREFETFHTGVLQAAAETIAGATQVAEANIKHSATASAERLNAAVSGSQQQADLLTNMLIRINQALSELPMMAKLELPNERLEKRIGALATEVESLVQQLEYVTAHVRGRTAVKGRRWYWLFLR